VTVRIATTIDAVRQAVLNARKTGQTIGLVPTMGALHAAHASLIRTARADTDYVVVSVFVNPTQFGPQEDLARYPRPFERDMALCAEENVQLVFAPEPAVIYPTGFRTFVEVTELEDTLCGAARPGHFRGVATVVLKLLNIVQPDVAYFGQKDAQQARILQQMTLDLNLPVRLIVCPIVREPDGLALSSRNQYLDADQRRQAPVLYKALEEVQKCVLEGEREAAKLLQQLRARLESTPGARLDYAAVVDADSLKPVTKLEKRVLVAVAVYFGSTRLIDNVVLDINHNKTPSPSGY
jgi:pantoate--beta-alanine ligase